MPSVQRARRYQRARRSRRRSDKSRKRSRRREKRRGGRWYAGRADLPPAPAATAAARVPALRAGGGRRGSGRLRAWAASRDRRRGSGPMARRRAPPALSGRERGRGARRHRAWGAGGGAARGSARARARHDRRPRGPGRRERTPTRGGRAHFVGLPRGEAWVLADAPGRARGSTRWRRAADRARSRSTWRRAHARGRGAGRGRRAACPAPSSRSSAPARSAAGRGARRRGRPRPRRAARRRSVARDRARPRLRRGERAGGRDGETLALVLRKLGAIAAHVVGAGRERRPRSARVAVAGATLWPARVATADDHGDVRIGGLQAGTYALRATKGDARLRHRARRRARRGARTSRSCSSWRRGRFVGVRVTDGDAADAAPVAAARVTLAEGGLSPFPLEATTDRAGARAPRSHRARRRDALGVRADGFVAARRRPGRRPAAAPRRASSLVRSGVLTGRVVDARGYPIDGATIEIVGTDPAGQPIFDDPRRAVFQAAHFDAMLGGPAPLVPAGELGVVPGPVPPIPNALGLAALARTAAPGAARRCGAPSPGSRATTGPSAPRPPRRGACARSCSIPQYVEAQSDIVTLAPGRRGPRGRRHARGGTLEGRVARRARPAGRACARRGRRGHAGRSSARRGLGERRDVRVRRAARRGDPDGQRDRRRRRSRTRAWRSRSPKEDERSVVVTCRSRARRCRSPSSTSAAGRSTPRR